MSQKRIFISADHGLAIVYFLQSDVLPTLLDGGAEVVLLTDDGLKEQISQRFGQPGLIVEGLRLKEARKYYENESAYDPMVVELLAPRRRLTTHQCRGHDQPRIAGGCGSDRQT